MPRSHRLAMDARRKSVALAALADESFIFNRRPTGPGLYDAIIAACNAAGFSPRVEQETHKNLAALSLVAAGLGVSVVPASMRHVVLDDVRYLRLSGAGKLSAPLYQAVRDEEQSAAVLQMMQQTRLCMDGKTFADG
ncbi:MAG: LysR substrate-binding domain-containing protein [Janthinobacterium lividum]